MTTRDMVTAASASPSLTSSNLAFADDVGRAIPIWLAASPQWSSDTLAQPQRRWLDAHAFKPASRRIVTLPDGDGGIAGVVAGAAPATRAHLPADPMAQPALLLGQLAQSLPPATYRLADALPDASLAATAWGLGAYRYRRYKTNEPEPIARLQWPGGIDSKRVRAIVDGCGFGRDLINTPANDLGPVELEAAARQLASAHGATISVIVGNDLIARNFPLIHAVGRASTRAPRLIDMSWGDQGPRVTLVGKGVCFDTGGLDLKPSSGMLLMKKDMGGAATVLALAHMIMATGLAVRLRVIIAAVENSVGGNAFRPGDVIASRAGPTVEIGNTDAEGRLVLCDALTLADEDKPDLLATFSTLTGAARTALGPEVPPFYTDDEALAQKLAVSGRAVGDPVWRLPFWAGYEAMLDSPVADMNNVSDSPFAGSIVAALYLRRFVKHARRFAHFDIYGWRPAAKPLGVRGGEVQGARALFQLLGSGDL